MNFSRISVVRRNPELDACDIGLNIRYVGLSSRHTGGERAAGLVDLSGDIVLGLIRDPTGIVHDAVCARRRRGNAQLKAQCLTVGRGADAPKSARQELTHTRRYLSIDRSRDVQTLDVDYACPDPGARGAGGNGRGHRDLRQTSVRLGNKDRKSVV